MKGKQDNVLYSDNTGKRWIILLAVVLLLAVFALCVQYVRLTCKPLESHDLSPSADPGRWSFSLEDGTVLEPEDGKLPLTGTDTVVICQTQLTGDVRELPLIVVTSKSSDCVFFLDGRLLYSPSGRYRNGEFSSDAFSTASGQFGLPALGDGKLLTMIVQFQGEENRLSRMPKLTLYTALTYYYSQHTSSAAEDALPAGIYFMVALFLAGLFLIGLWKRRCDPGLILLAFCALSMAFMHTISYSYSVMALLGTPTITWFCSDLPRAAMSWTLWNRLSKKLRLFSLPIPGLTTIAMLALLVLGLNNTDWIEYISIMTAWIMPAAVLLMLIAAAIDAAKGNPWFRRFFRYLAFAVPVVALAWGFSALTDGKLAQTMTTTFEHIANYHSLFKPCEQLCILLLILMFIQAVVDLISELARRDAELQALSLREKYTAENLKLMLNTQESTRRERHELRHHVALMDEMLSSGQEDQARTYVHSLLDKVAALPSDAYSTDPIINAIVARYLNEAKAQGITVTAEIKATEKPALRDDELCVLLTNMLENALEACSRMAAEADRFIRFKLRAPEGHLIVTCENSTDAALMIDADGNMTTSKKDAEHHGFGLTAMRQITEKHHGHFSVFCSNGCFTVKVTI